jgi:hypothetical protein
MTTTTSPSPFCSQATETEFNLKHITARLLVAPDAAELFNLSRCQQLSVLINLLLKGSSEETVTRINDECLNEWRKVAGE